MILQNQDQTIPSTKGPISIIAANTSASRVIQGSVLLSESKLLLIKFPIDSAANDQLITTSSTKQKLCLVWAKVIINGDP